SGIVLFRSTVYKSLAISFGQKMAWIIPVGHLPKKLHLQVEFRHYKLRSLLQLVWHTSVEGTSICPMRPKCPRHW
ncbi:MAG: hypothetical protein ACI93R_003687, partial [Flavobacteriales bacterium]